MAGLRVAGLLEGRVALTMISSGAALGLGLLLEFMHGERLFSALLFVFAAVLSGYRTVWSGIVYLSRGRVTIALLMTIAAIGAFLIGHGEEGAAVLFLFFIAESLEEGVADKSRRSIESLVREAPRRALIQEPGGLREASVDEVKVGDIVVVKPGEKIPLDGVVVEGVSSVNQSSITGESAPVLKERGEQVYAGSVNIDGFLKIRVTKTSGETVLDTVIKTVEKALRSRSRIEGFVERFASYYTPLVILLAVLTAVVPTLVFSQPADVWIYRSLVLLVVSCPCALAISTPATMFSSIFSAHKNGILIKGGMHIEKMSKAKVVAVDKTGTLTSGEPRVTDFVAFNLSEKHALSIAHSIESLVSHPIAEAISRYARERGAESLSISGFENLPGKGAKAEVGGSAYYVGGTRLLAAMGMEPPSVVQELQRSGKTCVAIWGEEGVVGVFGLMDSVRPEAEVLIRHLKGHGIKVVMMTGDNEAAASAIAKRLGIDEWYAGLLPEEKASIVERLRRRYGSVVVIGDGINDAPALAAADVGIAMGAIGSGIAIEAADAALMRDDLSRVPYLLDLSIRTMRKIKENITLSIVVKGIFASLAFPGLTTLWLAVAIGDMGVSLAVILNAMHLSMLTPRIIGHL